MQIDSFVASIRTLPSLPAVLVYLTETMGKDTCSIDELAAKLLQDQALTAKVLRLANSSFYGIPRQVESVGDAVAILGLRTTRSMVMAAALTNTIAHDRCQGFSFKAFWRHSMAVAVCARDIAGQRELDEEVAFTAGLLHDIGRLALSALQPELFMQTLAYRHEHDCLVTEAEQAVLHTDHAALGGLIAEHWSFSPQLVKAITAHHFPPDDGLPSIDAVIHVADNIAHALDIGATSEDMVPQLNLMCWSALKLDEPTCRHVFEKLETQLDALCGALLN